MPDILSQVLSMRLMQAPISFLQPIATPCQTWAGFRMRSSGFWNMSGVEIEKERVAVAKYNVKLQEEKAMLEEEKVAREKECEELKKENLALLKKVNNLEDVAEKTEEAERFLAEKQTRVLVSRVRHTSCSKWLEGPGFLIS